MQGWLLFGSWKLWTEFVKRLIFKTSVNPVQMSLLFTLKSTSYRFKIFVTLQLTSMSTVLSGSCSLQFFSCLYTCVDVDITCRHWSNYCSWYDKTWTESDEANRGLRIWPVPSNRHLHLVLKTLSKMSQKSCIMYVYMSLSLQTIWTVMSLCNSFISADAFPTEDVSHFCFIIVTYVSGYFTLCVGKCDRQDAFWRLAQEGFGGGGGWERKNPDSVVSRLQAIW